ncbi:cupin domain-containing protein [Umezawaea beigongshangensis]|uniref:cupin domain-containing protein n=1 Tax=Umezawaea beigongshangensis TaxID=2780383 RepID=UPI0018F26777|nr:cupin domain-containing protein [Umezawaea beigongshangensis]
MIVTNAGGLSRAAGDGAWRCLARRGMLHSECEAVDYVRLAPGATRNGRGREGVEGAWFVLGGRGRFLDGEDRSVPLRPGDLLLSSGGTSGAVHNDSADDLELLSFAVLPAAVTDRLPARIPVARWLVTGGDHD